MSDIARGTIFSGLTEVGQNITAGICNIKQIICINTSGAAAFVQLFDAAAANVTIGSTVPALVIPVAATSGITQVYFGDSSLGWNIKTRLSAFSTTTATGSTGSAATVYLQAFLT